MQNVLILVALVAVAFVVAHMVVDRLQHRFLVSTGAEYILVGLLIGPEMPWPSAFEHEMLTQVAPIMTLAIGWVGLLYGMGANIRELMAHRDGSGQLALVEGAITAGAVGLAAWGLLRAGLLGELDTESMQVAAWVLGTSAMVGSTSVIDLLQRCFGANGPLTRLLERASRVGELLAIIVFGLVFCFHHPLPVGMVEDWNYANWVLVTVGLGMGLGVVFRLFLGQEHDADKRFLALLGIAVFASGAAYLLRLSPLLVNLVLGVVLANVAPNVEEILTTLQRYHRGMIIVLLIFAGALWRPFPAPGMVVVVIYVVVRLAAKLLGGWLGVQGLDRGIRRDAGRGLGGHGEVAVAMALSYRLVYQGAVADVVFTAILGSVVVAEVWSARMVRGLLIDAGEIQADRRVLR